MTTTPQQESGPGGRTSGLEALWDAMRRSGVARDTEDRWLGGVCAGVAARLQVDPALVRVATIVLGLAGGVGVLAYAAAWLLVPDVRGRIEAQRALGGDVSGSVVAALALLAVAVLVPAPWAWLVGEPLLDGGDLVALAVLTAVVVAALAWLPRQHGGEATREAGPRRRGPGPAATALAAGAALLAAGSAWLLGRTMAVPGDPAVLAGCAALAVLGATVVALGLAGRVDGGVGFLGAVVALSTLAAAVVPSWTTARLAGDPRWRPASVAEAERGWSLGAGSAVLNLADLPVPQRGEPVEIPVRVGFGDLTVEVPRDAVVRVDGRVAIGAVANEVGRGGGPQVVVDARVLVGEVSVVEVDR